jgi:hypothetical protein
MCSVNTSRLSRDAHLAAVELDLASGAWRRVARDRGVSAMSYRAWSFSFAALAAVLVCGSMLARRVAIEDGRRGGSRGA